MKLTKEQLKRMIKEELEWEKQQRIVNDKIQNIQSKVKKHASNNPGGQPNYKWWIKLLESLKKEYAGDPWRSEEIKTIDKEIANVQSQGRSDPPALSRKDQKAKHQANVDRAMSDQWSPGDEIPS